jgi:hypothetical protein
MILILLIYSIEKVLFIFLDVNKSQEVFLIKIIFKEENSALNIYIFFLFTKIK